MKVLVKTVVFAITFVLLAFIQTKVFAKQDNTIEMLAGISKPPFIVAGEDKGMQLDIIAAALAKNNKVVQFTYLPLSRHLDVFHSREFDGITTLGENEKEWGLCLSKPYIIYQNVVVTLVSSNLNINQLSDLSKLKVAAFQNATRFLGEKYKAVFEHSVDYVELAEQSNQLELLLSGKVDALIIDINIFKFLLANKRRENPTSQIYNKDFLTYFFFEPKAYKAGFKSKQLCQQFDQGISAIIADGSYQNIIDSYLAL
ncbi:hypothetical protein NBRC116592_27740 [Colwellia sp. KU-HH00111]|uniref:substrate-binding periplasmic protein n=1 Tax=Colwellia sp. KU-HH00111 TaxID=3127652 RepID=UPI003102198D